LGLSTNFNVSLEVLKGRRPSQMEWIRYYSIPEYDDLELTLGFLATIKGGWEEQLGGLPSGNTIEEERIKWEFDPPVAEPDYEILKPSIGE